MPRSKDPATPGPDKKPKKKRKPKQPKQLWFPFWPQQTTVDPQQPARPELLDECKRQLTQVLYGPGPSEPSECQ